MWDERYNQAEFIYGKEANDFLKAQFDNILKGGRVLCLAEGGGVMRYFWRNKVIK